MIAKTAILTMVLERIKKMPVGHYLDLRTYKRNRSVIVVKKADDDFLVIEDGYGQEEFRVEPGKLRRLLKTLLKKEFPRSRKVRLYSMGEYSPDKVKDNLRKVI